MVFDRIENLKKYVSPEQFQKIARFLEQLSPDMEEKRYEIDGEKIYAKVMSYATSLRADCQIEAHNQYIDIQSSLEGTEGIDIFERDRLCISQEYDEAMEAAFYEETILPYASVNNVPGYFTMIFPEEAHRPQVSVNQKCEKVKKFVIKMKR